MAKLKKLKKKIKKIKQKFDQEFKLFRKAQKEIKSLKRKLQKRDQLIADLQRQHVEKKVSTPPPSTTTLLGETADKKLTVDYKSSLKRNKFLIECYEVHLGSVQEKDRARAMANQDLMDRYGEEFGFTKEQLGDILS